MRSLSYKLANGTVTESYNVAKASGLPFKAQVNDIPTPWKPMSEKRKAKLAEYFSNRK